MSQSGFQDHKLYLWHLKEKLKFSTDSTEKIDASHISKYSDEARRQFT